MNLLEKIKSYYSPTLIKNFIKDSLDSLFQYRGSVILLLLILFLYFSWSFTLMYYKFNINITNYAIERITEEMEKDFIRLKTEQNNLKCYKNQFDRISNDQVVNIWYCK